jgi:hypothetical protein
MSPPRAAGTTTQRTFYPATHMHNAAHAMQPPLIKGGGRPAWVGGRQERLLPTGCRASAFSKGIEVARAGGRAGGFRRARALTSRGWRGAGGGRRSGGAGAPLRARPASRPPPHLAFLPLPAAAAGALRLAPALPPPASSSPPAASSTSTWGAGGAGGAGVRGGQDPPRAGAGCARPRLGQHRGRRCGPTHLPSRSPAPRARAAAAWPRARSPAPPGTA